MGEHDELIDVLNEAVSLEYTGAVQYSQHSMLVTGKDKAIFEDFFEEGAEEGMEHAKLWGEKIVWLGGAPSAEVGTVRQSTDVEEMLEYDLEHEKKAVDVYSRALEVCEHEPTQYLLEDHIIDEQEDVEEVQKYLGKVDIADGTATVEKEVV
ncbi:MAG: bacterioferritin [bacterium]